MKKHSKILLLSSIAFFSMCSTEPDPISSTIDLNGNAEAPTVSIKFSTSTSSGEYGPNHTKAVWIEDSEGNVIRTLGRWAEQYVHTLSWSSLKDVDIDVKTGATEKGHGEVTINNWDITNKSGASLTDGDYNLKIEFNEDNSVSRHEISTTKFRVESDSVYQTSSSGSDKIKAVELTYKR